MSRQGRLFSAVWASVCSPLRRRLHDDTYRGDWGQAPNLPLGGNDVAAPLKETAASLARALFVAAPCRSPSPLTDKGELLPANSKTRSTQGAATRTWQLSILPDVSALLTPARRPRPLWQSQCHRGSTPCCPHKRWPAHTQHGVDPLFPRSQSMRLTNSGNR